MESFTIPRFGAFSYIDSLGVFTSEPHEIPLFHGDQIRISVGEEVIQNGDLCEVTRVLENIFELKHSRLTEAEPYVHQYYLDTVYEEPEFELGNLKNSSDVWQHVRLGHSIWVLRRTGDGLLYGKFACNCDWNPEHGMDLTLRNGEVFSRIGPHHHSISYADIYSDDSYDDVIYDSVLKGPML